MRGSQYYEELTSERLRTKYIKGRPYLEWVKPAGKRNEGLDTFVYALAAAVYCGVTRWKPHDWQQLAAKLARDAKPMEQETDRVSGETVGDEIAASTDQAPSPEPTPKPATKIARPPMKRRGGFVGRF